MLCNEPNCSPTAALRTLSNRVCTPNHARALGLGGHHLVGHLRDGKFVGCSIEADRNCVSRWLLPSGDKHDYEAGKPVPRSECQPSCECTGNLGYYFADLPHTEGKKVLQPYNYGKTYGEVRT